MFNVTQNKQVQFFLILDYFLAELSLKVFLEASCAHMVFEIN